MKSRHSLTAIVEIVLESFKKWSREFRFRVVVVELILRDAS